MSASQVQGFCHADFAKVQETFQENFVSRNEIGAAFSLVRHGEVLVDLWGGHLDKNKQRVWPQDGLCTVWSIGKAMTALCALILIDEEKIDLNEKVSHYWPEYGCGGKEITTIRQLLSHQSGTSAFREVPDPLIWQDWKKFNQMLAEQQTWWEPGTRHGYHVFTYANLVGEIVQRVSGQTLNNFFQQRVAKPLGIECIFGVDASESARLADTIWPLIENLTADSFNNVRGSPEDIDLDSLRRNLSYLPPVTFDPESGINTQAWRGASFPSANAQSNARSIAKVFSVLSCGGAYVDSKGNQKQLLSRQVIEEARKVQVEGHDATIDKPSRFGLGFMIASKERPWGPNLENFGHYGNNGLLAFADPEEEFGFCYVMNNQGVAWRDPRNIALVDAVYESLAI